MACLRGMPARWGVQLLAIVATVAIAALGTLGILALVQATIGARADDLSEENAGLDLSQHGEEAYSARIWAAWQVRGGFPRRQRGRRVGVVEAGVRARACRMIGRGRRPGDLRRYQAPEPFSGNLSFVGDYRFRGVVTDVHAAGGTSGRRLYSGDRRARALSLKCRAIRN